MDGGSEASEEGIGDCGSAYGDPAKADARRVEFVEAEDVVESSGISTTFQVCKVASGAKETLRAAIASMSAIVASITDVSTNPMTFALRPFWRFPPVVLALLRLLLALPLCGPSRELESVTHYSDLDQRYCLLGHLP